MINCDTDEATKASYEEDTNRLEKSLVASEKLIANPFPRNFYKDLCDNLYGTNIFLPNDIGGLIMAPIKARF